MAADSTTATSPNGANGAVPAASNGTTTTTGDDMTTTTGQSLTADEIAIYDRQIRLWGAQAQERIRSAHILLVSLRALGTEIAKNLVLAGISSLTIIDDEAATEEDLGAQYFLREDDVGKPRAEAAIPRIQELNPRVNVKSDGGLANLLIRDPAYYASFSIVIACDLDFWNISMINTAARMVSTPFYAAGVHGFYGYTFADLVAHEFVVEREKSNRTTAIGPETLTRSVLSVSTKKESQGGAGEKTVEIVKKQEMYCPLILANSSPLPMDILSSRRKLKAVPALLPCLRALFDFQREKNHFPSPVNRDDLTHFTALATQKSRELQLPPETLKADFLRSFIQNIGAEMVPTAAFVGGRLSEDVINVLGKREQPIQNFALFDGDGLEGKIYSLYSPPPEQTPMMPMDGNMDMMGQGSMMDMGMMPMMGMDDGMGGQMNMGGGMDMMGGMVMMDGTMMDANGNMVGGMGGMDNQGFENGGLGGMQDMQTMLGNDGGDTTTAEAANPGGEAGTQQDPPRSVPEGEQTGGEN